MKAIHGTIKFVTSLAPLLRTATPSATGIDLQNSHANFVFFNVGALTDGTYTPKLQESSDNSTWTDVAAADMVGTLAAFTANTNQKVGYIGAKRYILPVVTVTGSPATGCNFAVIAGLGMYRKQAV